MTESEYKNLPDYDFRTQYDANPRPDKDVESALRGDYDHLHQQHQQQQGDASVTPYPDIRWVSPWSQRIR